MLEDHLSSDDDSSIDDGGEDQSSGLHLYDDDNGGEPSGDSDIEPDFIAGGRDIPHNIEAQILEESENYSNILFNHTRINDDLTENYTMLSEIDKIPQVIENYLSTFVNSFSIWSCIGYWLLNRQSDKVRLMYASSNTTIGTIDGSSVYIDSFAALRRYITDIRDFDYGSILRRPDTSWVFLRLAYVRMITLSFDRFFLRGCEEFECVLHPQFYKNKWLACPSSEYIAALGRSFADIHQGEICQNAKRTKGQKRAKNYFRKSFFGNHLPHFPSKLCVENLCFFIALALSENDKFVKRPNKKQRYELALKIKKMVMQWLTYRHRKKLSDLSLSNEGYFPGITFGDLPHLEKAFNIRLNIFKFENVKSFKDKRAGWSISPLYLSGYKPSEGEDWLDIAHLLSTNEPGGKLKLTKPTKPTVDMLLVAHSISVTDTENAPENVLTMPTGHLLYIRDLQKLCGEFICWSCKEQFRYLQTLRKHLQRRSFRRGKCPSRQKKGEFANSGPWKATSSIFTEIFEAFPQLSQFETSDLSSDFYQVDSLIVFDSESLHLSPGQYAPMASATIDSKNKSTASLYPFLISAISNIKNHTECQLFWAETQDEIGVSEMVSKFGEWIWSASQTQAKIYEERFKYIFKYLVYIIEHNQKGGNLLIARQAYNFCMRLSRYLRQCPIIAYNCDFDLKLIREYMLHFFIMKEQEECGRKQPYFSSLVRGRKFLSFSTSRFKFVDTTNYLGIIITYDSFLKNMGSKSRKLKIPYEYLTSLETLDRIGLPPPDDPGWNSKLHGNKTILGDPLYNEWLKLQSERGLEPKEAAKVLGIKGTIPPKSPMAEWIELAEYYKSEGCYTMRDIVAKYAFVDTIPLLECNLKLAKEFREMLKGDSCNLFRDFVSLPSISLKLMSQHLCKIKGGVTGLYVPSLKTYKLLNKHITGGISVSLVRECIKDKTPIRSHMFGPNEALTSRYLTSYDVRALYPACLRSLETMGPAVVRTAENHFKGEYDDPRLETHFWSELVGAFYGWLWKAKSVKSKMNSNGEYRSTNSLRGFCVDIVITLENGNRVALEVFGGVHYCAVCKPPLENIHPVQQIPNELVHKADMDRIEMLKNEFNGNISVVYLCQFKREVVKSSLFSEFLKVKPEFKQRHLSRRGYSEKNMIKAIQDRKIVGLVMASFYTPPHLRYIFDQFPLLIKKVMMSKNNVDQKTREFCEQYNLLNRPRQTLIQTFSVDDTIINTRLFCFYLRMGLKVTSLKVVIQYQSSSELAPLVDWIMNMRRDAANSNIQDAADYAKRFKSALNTLYGSTIRRSDLNTKMSITKSKATLFQKKENMISCECLASIYAGQTPIYLITEKQQKIIYKSLPHVGIDILCTSKLTLFSFIYDF